MNPETQRRLALAVFALPYAAFMGYVTVYHLRRYL